MGETNALRSIAVGLASAHLAAHKTMEKPCMKTFFLKSKKNMLEKTILMFHVFFFKYILMKDMVQYFTNIYKTSKSRHYFQKLVTCNEKPP